MRILILSLAIAFLSPAFSSSLHAAAPERDWTFLIFLNGKNNLDIYGDLNLNQLEQVGSNEKVNVVVQWGSLRRPSVDRVLVHKDSDTNAVTSPVVESLGSVDMGSWRSLEEFILWGMREYPAKHYFVTVWNHGSGWRNILNLRGLRGGELKPTDISWDDETGNSITTEQLGEVMRRVSTSQGRKIDIYGSDACLMAMAEVAGEMRGGIDYMVGSQELEPGLGWPYFEFYQRWASMDYASPADVSRILVEEYTKSYQGGSNGNDDVTLSAVDMSKYDAFTSAMREFSLAVSAAPAAERAPIKDAVNEAQAFYYSDYGDLIDFLDVLESNKSAGSLLASAQNLKSAAKDFVLLNRVTDAYRRANGVSVWMPKYSYQHDSYRERYGKLLFNADTKWGDAIAHYLAE